MKCCGTGLWRYSEASEQDSNIVYGFHLIPIYNRAQFVDKTDPCCSTSRRQGRCGQVPLWNAIWNATRIAPWHPFSGFCWRCTCLSVLTLGMQCLEDTSLTMPPASIRLGRESAPQVQAVKGGLRATRRQADGGHCPSLQWSCAQMEARKGRYIYPLPRESAITPLLAFLCYGCR